MGALGPALKQALVKRLGQRWWELNADRVDRIWGEIESALLRLDLHYPRVRLYQDGLPICGRELAIVTELAAAGSRNHQLLLRLASRGATVMGTESAELLVEEYQLIRQLLAAEASKQSPAMGEPARHALTAEVLRKRDEFIAGRINATLLQGEIGILFLGVLHSFSSLLAADIKLTSPFLSPGARTHRWKPSRP